jgi:hypothetical protein
MPPSFVVSGLSWIFSKTAGSFDQSTSNETAVVSRTDAVRPELIEGQNQYFLKASYDIQKPSRFKET